MIPASQPLANENEIRRVLIVDDSKAMCAFLQKVIDADPTLTVVGCALDPYEARDMIKEKRPDILTLDIEMPRMDGLTFLKNLMRLRPMPVVMISSMTSAGAAVSLEALSIGAIDFMVKRRVDSAEQLQEYTDSIRNLVKSAAATGLANNSITGKINIHSSHKDLPLWRNRIANCSNASTTLKKVICIGASTGGPEAVKHVLENMDISGTAAIVTQHMPSRFIGAFAERLNKASNYQVETSYDGAPLKPGICYVSDGESHTAVIKSATGIQCKLLESDKINGHRPAVDALFNSAAKSLGSSAVGILLTGMGNDGASGLKSMHDQGSFTIAQDEKSSAVWGMPGSAVRLDAADAILPLEDIASTLGALLSR